MKPNILFILADDLGSWALGSYGNCDVITPNLDKLAKRGARFENFFCTSPVCSPARASILTGKMPSSHGVHDWIRSGNIDKEKLSEEQKTMLQYAEEKCAVEYMKEHTTYTEILKEDGYLCALSGKWHLGNSSKAQKGFEWWNVIARGGCTYYNSDFFDGDDIYFNDGYITDTVTDHAIDFLENRPQDRPFYLSVHYTAPHTPWNADQHPKEIYSLYKDCECDSIEYEELHPWQSLTCQIGTKETRKDLIRGYYTAITAMDRNIGRLFEVVGTELENTLIVFMSDNGMNLGQHGVWGKGNGTFPMNMYDSSVKVPLIIAYKDIKPHINTSLLSQYDFMPTLLDFVELENNEKMIGTSFKSELLNMEETTRPIVVFDEYGPVRMIRDKKYKYVHRYPYGEHEFYDLENDPKERNNIFSNYDYQKLIEEYKSKLERWFFDNTNPALDGTKEAVSGFGQLNLAGLQAKGKKNYKERLDKFGG